MNSGYTKARWLSLIMANIMAVSSFLTSAPLQAFASSAEPVVNVETVNTAAGEISDETETARVYVNNTPIRLEVSKIKTHVGDHEGLAPESYEKERLEDTVTYQWSGRLDGSVTHLIQTYGSDNVELAYALNGKYLGYGWRKGTLEYLEQRKKQEQKNKEIVELQYNEHGIFAGYAYITKKLETTDDENRYVAGAVMTLYDAVEVYKLPSAAGDDRFPGVTIERNSNGDVTNVYVQKGYAGNKVEFVLSNGEEADENSYDQKDEINDKGEGTWIAKTIERNDTPILYYNLNDLIITTNDTYHTQMAENQKAVDAIFGANRYDKEQSLYGLNRAGDVVNINQHEETDFTVFAFQSGNTDPVFEFVGGDFREIRYNALSKTMTIGAGTTMYHLDADGNRDAKVDPQTGIAYLTEELLPEEVTQKANEPGIVPLAAKYTSYETYGRIYVWPVNIYKDRTGSKTAQKIKTNRIAAFSEDTEDEYVTGTYTGTEFAKKLNPTYDENGLPIYYQKSNQTYKKGTDLFDRDGDYLGFGYSDQLDAENLDAYQIKDHNNLYNGDADDPFDQSTHYQYSSKMRIKVTIDAEGNYIVDGADTVPKPRRAGRVFGGWLVEPNDLTSGMTVNALWRVAGSSMSEDQKNKWYSNRAATGTTKTMTVTFDANGGEFFDGSGAIHSDDNLLYYRQGESYIIENTWMTGENTPNNPFDERVVASIDQTSDTANDPYRTTANGGRVDVIKRIPAGLYILEELSSPAGYVKGLPVGVNVERNESVQMTEMVDTTIKVEISKVDAADTYTFNRYLDGQLVTNPAGEKEVVTEPKGSYSYGLVPGAVLAIYGDNADNTEYFNWIKATAFVPDGNKRHDSSHGDYIVVDSSSPILIEGIPAGNYIISEIQTPNGYITAPDIKVTIREEQGIQLILMNDDHTKVEVEKYYHDGEGRVTMPNLYRAGLQLKNEDGEVVSEWYSDDGSAYQNFMTEFAEQVKQNNGAPFDSIAWSAEHTALLQAKTEHTETWRLTDGTTVLIEQGNIPNEASTAFKEAYAGRNLAAEQEKFTYLEPMSAVRSNENRSYQLWRTNIGAMVQVCVYPDKEFDTDGKQTYVCEYKFNYKDDYTGAYQNLVSYDTADGIHRFDYLPTGRYVLHEFDVPDGFMQAEDQTIDVTETADIQQFRMLNKQRELVVTKVAKDSKGQFYAGVRNGEVTTNETGIEITGAKLRLYRVNRFDDAHKEAFKNNKVPEGAVLVTEWVSGSNGVYTKEDEQKERIPFGYQVGDLKPHTIKDLEDGCYYLVEAETPGYYRTAEPIEVEVNNQTSNVTVENQLMPGKVQVLKVNQNQKGLAGAAFTIKNQTLGTVAGYIITGQDGRGTLILDEIGVIGKDGVVDPYVFTLEETSPPAGYQLDTEVHEFTFDGTGHGDYAITYNVNDASHTNGVIKVIDSETAITIAKTDFDTNMGVPGATLSVYEAVYEGTQWTIKNPGQPVDTWTTKAGETTHVVKGLVGAGNYVVVEATVPEGYVKAEDIFFRVSNDGKSIAQMWTDKAKNTYIEFTADNTGAVEQVSFVTKAFAGSKTVLTNLNDQTVKEYGTATNGFTLTEREVTDGGLYRLDEIVKFTDGSETVVRSTTFLARLEDGSLKIFPKNAATVENIVAGPNGTIIAKWISDGSRYTIHNPLQLDTQGITIKNTTLGSRIAGQDHEAVSAGKQVVYTISYQGKGKEIVLSPDNKTDIIRTEPAAGRETDGTYRWTTDEEQGEIRVVASVKDTSSGYINQKVTIDTKQYSYMNPIAVNEGSGFLKNTSKIVLFNDVIGNHQGNDAASFTYRITLTDADGKPLNGSYTYRTKDETSGTHAFDAYGKESTFDVTLLGSDYLVIHDLPYHTKYSVRLLVTENHPFSVQSGTVNDYGHPINLPAGTTTKESISNIYFSNTRNVNTEREIFKRNESYELIERVVMSDDTTYALSQTGFTLGEHCEVISFDVVNRRYPIYISKRYVTGEAELPGATLQLLNMEETILEEWVSTKEEHKIKTVLEPGNSYILRELTAPDGYTYSEDIIFTVSPDGTINRVVMYDTFTRVYIEKVDENGLHVNGAKLQILDEKGSVVEEWMSNGAAHELVNRLNAGETYTLREVRPPAGNSFAQDITFTVSKDAVTTVTMVNHETKVQITKRSSELDEEGNPILLYGARLQILDADKKPVAAIKDSGLFEQGDLLIFSSNNTVEITGLLSPDTDYYLREIKPVNGYAFAEDVKFRVNKEHQITVVEMVDEPIEGRFTKTDITGEEELPGATITITDKNGKVIDTWSSTTEPHVITKKFIAGESYTLTETVSPDGYAYVSNIIFKVERDGTITIGEKTVDENHVLIKDKPTDVRISKVDITNQTELPGARLAVKDAAGTIIEEWVSTGTPHIIKAKLIASVPDRDGDGVWDVISKYTLVELLPADGYAYAEKIEFIVSPDGSIDKVKMEDKLTHVEVSKRSITGEEELPGAKLQLLDGDGILVEEWISTDKPHVIKGKLIAGKTYTLHEDGAPAGYYYTADITFTVSKDGSVDRVVMKDQPTKVQITKKDITNEEELPGAKLQIIDKDGKVIEEWISTGKPHVIEGKLNPGEEYTLHEDGAPAGYGYAEDITFVVSEDGTIETVVMFDKPTEVKISKVDITNETELPGARLQILDADGTVVEEWISTDEPHTIKAKLQAGETYTLHEDGNPAGYNYTADIQFQVPRDGSPITVTMKDKPTVVEVSKTDITGDEELPGAKLQIKDKTGNIVDEWTSTDKPHIITGVLEPGETYTMHEEGAPDGYGYTSDIEFTVSEDGSIDKVHMKDETLKLKVIKWKQTISDETNPANLLGGATLQIIDENGTVVDEWVTEEGKSHEIVSKFPSTGISVISDAVYTLREVKVPDGWTKAKDITFTAAHDGTLKVVHMVDTRPDKPRPPGENPRTPGDKPRTPTITITKQNAANLSSGVAGAEYTIYNSNGTVYRVVNTDKDGTATFTRPANGTYTFKETKVPEGYMLDESTYHFTVSNGVVKGTLNVIDYPKFQIEVIKKDSETLALLPGASIEIYDSKGNLTASGTTGSDGIFAFSPDYDDVYTAVEVKAPDGYELTEKVFINFTVKDGRVIGDTTIYNSKSNNVGFITASYDYGAKGKGYAWIDEYGVVHFGKTGDTFNQALLVAGMVLAALGLIVLWIRRKKHDKN